MPLNNISHMADNVFSNVVQNAPSFATNAQLSVSPQSVTVGGNVQVTGLLVIGMVVAVWLLAKNWPI